MDKNIPKVKLYIARHADFKKEDGHDDSLNEKGVQQSLKLAEKLKNYHIKRIYTSKLARAKETAEIVSKALNIPIIEDPVLNEFPGKIEKEEDCKRHKMQIKKIESFIKKISVTDGSIIIAHGNINKAIFSILMKIPFAKSLVIMQRNASINIFYKLGQSKLSNPWRVRVLGDTSYLPKELIS